MSVFMAVGRAFEEMKSGVVGLGQLDDAGLASFPANSVCTTTIQRAHHQDRNIIRRPKQRQITLLDTAAIQCPVWISTRA